MIDRGGDEGAERRERVAIRARARAEPPRRRGDDGSSTTYFFVKEKRTTTKEALFFPFCLCVDVVDRLHVHVSPVRDLVLELRVADGAGDFVSHLLHVDGDLAK